MDKKQILESIIATLQQEVDVISAAAKESRQFATDAENRAEDKYDTRATETSYLADGQGRVALEMRESLEMFRSMELKAFPPGQAIALSALVEVEQGGMRDLYFLGPRAGGQTVTIEGREIYVVTPQSPLGAKLLGQLEGASIALAPGRSGRIVRVE
ncbi:hypothetical protein ASA1KI_40380 [Opitutales bacterium ASA1]|uniref:transcription elongation factor GreAB n=1 Tax=Congregicoccus parvus TaxID=3081749 RepID=UPI002B2A8F53|nr:hypothetical protein ASA1KI_40380 [Opitutales bacterium ASA1]